MAIDLTGGEVKVIGNVGDKHLFRLSNPDGQEIIGLDGQYEAKFLSSRLQQSATSPVALDLSELATGSLLFELTIQKGFYRIRRLNPRRTLLTIEVEAK